ncbi:MAG: hypothetical protein FJW31_21425 [Acidobacteria bacterium]|nr:hypothetical protein [Acidobacteriota bacterium]
MKRTTLLFLPALALGFGVDDWPLWRGPLNNGVVRGDVPAEFGPEKNVAWKLDLPGRGFSLPVLWGDLFRCLDHTWIGGLRQDGREFGG